MAKRQFDEGRGPSQRQLRVGELIRRTLSETLARGDLFDPDLAGKSITVGEVRLSTDLRVATVYVMPLGGGDVDQVIKALARHKFALRKIVTSAVSLKYSPDLRFQPDRTFDQMDETRRLLSGATVARDIEADDEEE